MILSEVPTQEKILFTDLGLMDYKTCWDYQEKIFNEIVQIKIDNRFKINSEKKHPQHQLLFVEHPHVYTLGKNGSISNLLINEQTMEEKGITFFKINRGGDITYHGPGQIVGYPIFDLDYFFTDIGKYLRYLEEAVILTLSEFGIVAGRSAGETGVWIEAERPSRARKICAIGVRCSRWVTMHGFAFNVNTDLDYFNYIIPCGITDKQVTSIHKELGVAVDEKEVKEKLKAHLLKLFNARWA